MVEPIEKWIPLAVRCARNEAARTGHFHLVDDYYGWALEGIWYGLQTFDPDKGATLAQYLSMKANYALGDQRRIDSPRSRQAQRVLKEIERATERLFQTLRREPDLDEIVEEVGRDKAIIQLRTEGYTNLEIGNQVGLCESRVGQVLSVLCLRIVERSAA